MLKWLGFKQFKHVKSIKQSTAERRSRFTGVQELIPERILEQSFKRFLSCRTSAQEPLGPQACSEGLWWTERRRRMLAPALTMYSGWKGRVKVLEKKMFTRTPLPPKVDGWIGLELENPRVGMLGARKSMREKAWSPQILEWEGLELANPRMERLGARKSSSGEAWNPKHLPNLSQIQYQSTYILEF